jgi:hypothetical protein
MSYELINIGKYDHINSRILVAEVYAGPVLASRRDDGAQ